MIVLDTHALLWFVTADQRLNPQLRQALESEPFDVWVPTICFWEAVLLQQRGRIQFHGGDLGRELPSAVRAVGFQEAPLTAEVAVLSRTLAFAHEDPADRFIAATAYALGAQLATSDQRLRELPWIKMAY